jgi:hypothetical protein
MIKRAARDSDESAAIRRLALRDRSAGPQAPGGVRRVPDLVPDPVPDLVLDRCRTWCWTGAGPVPDRCGWLG